MQRVLAPIATLLAVSCGGEPQSGDAWQGTIEVVDGRSIVHNPPVGVWGADARGHLSENLRIGAVEGDGPEAFGSIIALAISSGGDIAVLDDQAQEVRVFDSMGGHLRTVGRRGEGPGEFEGAVAVHYDAADRLWVADARNRRYSVFSASGEYLNSVPRSRGVVLGDPGRFTRRGFLDPFPRLTPEGGIEVLYLVVDSTGSVLDTLPPISVGQASVLQNVPISLSPFMSRTISTPGVEGDLWIANTGHYTLFRRVPAGDTVLMAELDVPTIQLRPEEQDSIDALIQSWPLPIDRPGLDLGPQYLRSIHPDELGRVFVRPNVPDGKMGSVFDAFDNQGRYLGRVEADVDFAARPPVIFRDGTAYGVILDSFDVPYVVRARLQIPPDSH